jgi:hypothetical protein
MEKVDNQNIMLQLEEFPTFYCKICDFKCEKKKYFQQHVKGKKHLSATNSIKNDNESNDKNENNKIETANTLSLLKIIDDLKNDKMQQQKIINDLLAQNKIRSQLLCQKSEQVPTTIIQQQIEPIKPAFCKTKYLNETCKDAMNLDDFLNSIEITLDEYINMKDDFVEGISKNLTQLLSTTQKTCLPFCCTNLRDKTVWIKLNQDTWVDDKEFKHLDKFIEKYSFKLFRIGRSMLIEKYPDCVKSSSKKSDTLNYCMKNCLDNEKENRFKVINKILKLITVEK